MDLKDLKMSLINKTLGQDFFFIFKYVDNSFLVNQYIDEISKITNLPIINVKSIEEMRLSKDDIFIEHIPCIYLIDIDELNESIQVEDLNRCIIKCNKVSKDVAEYTSNYIVEFSKLLDWQILDYAKTLVPGLDVDKLKWLCDICKYDIYRVHNECMKLSVFPKQSQSIMFDLYNNENMFSDLSTLTIFNFISAITKKDKNAIIDVLQNIDNIDVEPVGVVTLLEKQFKNIINIQMNSKATPESLNMKPNQFNAIKWNCGKYTDKQLIDIYEMLTSIDYQLKSGLLDCDKIIDYVLINVL